MTDWQDTEDKWKAFNPDQTRDEHGRFTSGGTTIGNVHVDSGGLMANATSPLAEHPLVKAAQEEHNRVGSAETLQKVNNAYHHARAQRDIATAAANAQAASEVMLAAKPGTEAHANAAMTYAHAIAVHNQALARDAITRAPEGIDTMTSDQSRNAAQTAAERMLNAREGSPEHAQAMGDYAHAMQVHAYIQAREHANATNPTNIAQRVAIANLYKPGSVFANMMRIASRGRTILVNEGTTPVKLSRKEWGDVEAKWKGNPDQSRDERGRFASGGSYDIVGAAHKPTLTELQTHNALVPTKHLSHDEISAAMAKANVGARTFTINGQRTVHLGGNEHQARINKNETVDSFTKKVNKALGGAHEVHAVSMLHHTYPDHAVVHFKIRPKP